MSVNEVKTMFQRFLDLDKKGLAKSSEEWKEFKIKKGIIERYNLSSVYNSWRIMQYVK